MIWWSWEQCKSNDTTEYWPVNIVPRKQFWKVVVIVCGNVHFVTKFSSSARGFWRGLLDRFDRLKDFYVKSFLTFSFPFFFVTIHKKKQEILNNNNVLKNPKTY